MENDELDWQQEVMKESINRIKREHQRQIELDERLEHYRLVKRAQIAGATIVAIGLMTIPFFIIESRKHGWGIPKPDPTTITETNTTIKMTTYYYVQPNDTLSGISSRTGIPMDDIAYDNDIKNVNVILPNERLTLNYMIEEEDLKYYTETIDVNGQSLIEIAGMYKTNQQTIVDLNSESIIRNDDGTYTIVSNTILVPKFITQSELKELKQEQK